MVSSMPRVTTFIEPRGGVDVDLSSPQKILAAIKSQAKEPEKWWDHAMNSNVDYLFTRFVDKKMRGWQVLQDRRLNILELIADSTADRIHLTGWKIGDKQSPPKRLRDIIEDIDERTGLSKFGRDLFLRSEIQGVTYLMIWPTEDGESGIIRATPSSVMVGYPDDGSSVWPEWAARVTKNNRQIDVLYRDRYDRWTRPKDGGQATWKKVRDGKEYPTHWPDAVPIVPFASVSLLNPRSGIRAAFGCQRSIDHCMGVDTISIELSAFPVRYTVEKLSGKDSNEVELSRGLQMDNEFQDSGEAQEPPIDVYPGAILDLQADLVGQFDPASPEATVGRIAFYAKAGLTLCGIPLSMWEGTTANNSGELMRRELQPLIGKVRQRTESYRASFQRVWELLLAQSQTPNRSNKITPLFDDPAMPDELYVWELVLTKLEAGVQPEVAWMEAGVPQDIIERMATAYAQRFDQEGSGGSGGSGRNGGTGTRGNRNRRGSGTV